MRVLLITQGVSRLVNPIFSSEHDVVGVIESMPRGFNPKNKRILFGFFKRIYCFFKKQSYSLRDICKDNYIPYNYIYAGRDVEIEEWVKELQPDLIVVFSMSQLLKKEIFSIPKYGAINMHPSFLPEYRGPNPDFWQYYNIEMHPGITIHYIDEGEDTGDVIFQERQHIPLGTKSPERLDKLIVETGVPLMLKAISQIGSGIAPRKKQSLESPTPRARNLKPEEHKDIIGWKTWSIERIWHVLRGTELWLNAIEQPKGFFKGHRWIVGDYVRHSNTSKPGSLVVYNGKRAIAMPEGYIFVYLKFDIKKTILTILNNAKF